MVDKTEKMEAKQGKRYFTFFRKFRGKFLDNLAGIKKTLKNFAGINFRERPKHYDFAAKNFRERLKNSRNRES